MRTEVLRPGDLRAAEITRWRALQLLNPSLSSPFFTPDYVMLLGAVRPDIRIAVFESERAIEGLFAVQGSIGSAGMPAGTPISDYSGIVAPPDTAVKLHDICRALKLGRLDFAQVPAEQMAFAKHAQATSSAWAADIGAGSVAYFAGVRGRHRNFLYQLSRTRRKFEREHGELDFAIAPPGSPHLETLLRWKGQQLRRANQPEVWRRRWIREALFRSHEAQNPHFGGALFVLTLGDRLVAANFCLRGGDVLHGFLMAHDRAFEAYSPGLQLMRHLLEWAPEHGVRIFDFGVGSQLYKRQFGTRQYDTVAGWAGPPSLASVTRAAQYAMRRQIEKIPNAWVASLPGRAMRRFDVYRGLSAPRMKTPLPALQQFASRSC
ncbi:MAG: GNAT family N-acetyltransferase [Pseudomonadota bacterium]